MYISLLDEKYIRKISTDNNVIFQFIHKGAANEKAYRRHCILNFCDLLNSYVLRTPTSRELYRSVSSLGLHCQAGSSAIHKNNCHTTRIGLRAYETLFKTSQAKQLPFKGQENRLMNPKERIWILPCSGPLAISSFPAINSNTEFQEGTERSFKASDYKKNNLSRKSTRNFLCRNKYSNWPILGTFLSRNPVTDLFYDSLIKAC